MPGDSARARKYAVRGSICWFASCAAIRPAVEATGVEGGALGGWGIEYLPRSVGSMLEVCDCGGWGSMCERACLQVLDDAPGGHRAEHAFEHGERDWLAVRAGGDRGANVFRRGAVRGFADAPDAAADGGRGSVCDAGSAGTAGAVRRFGGFIGVDARGDGWLAGVSVSRSGAEADYSFDGIVQGACPRPKALAGAGHLGARAFCPRAARRVVVPLTV